MKINKTMIVTVGVVLGSLYAINTVDALQPVKRSLGLGTGIL